MKKTENYRSSLPDRIRKRWGDHSPEMVPPRSGRMSAVLLPMVCVQGEYHLLYEVRARDLDAQPGEVCFPGGRIENGENAQEAAIRETREELLVREDQIEILAPMDGMPGPNGAPIWPYLGLLKDYRNTFSTDEVDHVFTVPIRWLLEHEPERYMTTLVTVPGQDFPFDLIPGGRSYPWHGKQYEILFYKNDQAVIWGITARITSYMIEHFKKDLL